MLCSVRSSIAIGLSNTRDSYKNLMRLVPQTHKHLMTEITLLFKKKSKYRLKNRKHLMTSLFYEHKDTLFI